MSIRTCCGHCGFEHSSCLVVEMDAVSHGRTWRRGDVALLLLLVLLLLWPLLLPLLPRTRRFLRKGTCLSTHLYIRHTYIHIRFYYSSRTTGLYTTTAVRQRPGPGPPRPPGPLGLLPHYYHPSSYRPQANGGAAHSLLHTPPSAVPRAGAPGLLGSWAAVPPTQRRRRRTARSTTRRPRRRLSGIDSDMRHERRPAALEVVRLTSVGPPRWVAGGCLASHSSLSHPRYCTVYSTSHRHRLLSLPPRPLRK